MSDPVLAILKYVVLAILYLFFLRVLRAVWVELREPKTVVTSLSAAPAETATTTTTNERPRSKKAPTRLVALDSPGADGEFEITDEMTVGRASGCGVSLPEDTFVSQIHARVFVQDEDVWVEDLGSTNGTFLNERPVNAPAVLRKGDKVRFGRTTMEAKK